MSSPPSSPQNPHTTTLLLPPSSTSSRRLPPPCWSHDETVALIDAYREKWYSLRRGNLRASHWQEVADAVAVRCPLPSGTPQKTSVQCRHKMEKLRKRYRAEIQRSVTTPKGHRYCSSWVHFNRMDAMEKGSTLPAVVTVNAQPIYQDVEEEEEDGDEDQDDLYSGRGVIKEAIPIHQSFYANNGVGGKSGGGGGPFRIKIPGRSNTSTAGMPPAAKVYSKFNDCNTNYGHSPNYNSGNAGVRDGHIGRFVTERSGGGSGRGGGGGKRREENPLEEMVEAIKMLGDGFVRMERMKMDMAREIEGMRMEMEMKRTEMILESQQKVVETFAKALLEKNNKKAKRMPSPES